MGIPEGVRVTNSTGVKSHHGVQHAMMLLLGLLRQLPECQAHQRTRLYTRNQTNAKVRTLEDATVCVFGRGAIGRELVRKLKAFDARVIAVSRTTADADDLVAVYRASACARRWLRPTRSWSARQVTSRAFT